MRITFITSGYGLSGGTKAIFELANHLTDYGHEVFVICSLTPFLFEGKWFNPGNVLTKILRLFKESKGCKDPKWFNVKANLARVPSLAEKHIPDADIILATWWETAYFVSKYSDSKGRKFYFVQDFEIWDKKREEEAKNSYRLGLKNIVNSNYVKEALQKRAGADVEAVVLHAPDHEQFYPEKTERKDSDIRILIPYRDEKWKGTKEGIEVFKKIKQKYPNAKLVMFGKKSGNLDLGGLEGEAEYHLAPVMDDLRRLYNSCDIFCYPSLEEGFGMPPMEAMACGLPVVATSAGAILEYAIDGETALISRPGDVEAMAKNIIELLENKEKRENIKARALEHIKQFTWDKATKELEEIFKKYL